MINSLNIYKVVEECWLDSRHYDLKEIERRKIVIDMLLTNNLKTLCIPENLKQAYNESYREEEQLENKRLPSSSNESFKNINSADFVKFIPILQIAFMDLKNFKQKNAHKKSFKTVLNRGQTLINMIKLDTVEWTLYESKPISYDNFIKSYGKLNTRQVCVQTNEDNFDIEIQTDEIEFQNKWTQFPIKCRNKLETFEDKRLFQMEYFGCGGDELKCTKLIKEFYDVLEFNEFLIKTGKIMLALLEERKFKRDIFQNEIHEFPFSDGFIKLSVNSFSFLCGRQVTILNYSEINNQILISIHAAKNMNIDVSNKQDYIINSCIGCIWYISEPLRPAKLFYSQSPIITCCFHSTNNNIVLAGLQDGSICLWDLHEEEIYHQIVIDKINDSNWIIPSPTYTTAGSWEIEAHASPIVAIRILSKAEENEKENLNQRFISIQICSLDEDGHFTIWSILSNFNLNVNEDPLTQWKIVKLVNSQELSLTIKITKSNNIKKEFVDMAIDTFDSNNLYLASDDTNILYRNCMGVKNNISYYEINIMDSCGNTTCVEICPFNHYYFFAGCKDGTIRLHFLNTKTPILNLREQNCTAGIKSIQWSKSKTLILYVLNNYSRIIIWDLCKDDIHPSHMVSTKTQGYVNCMKLSPCFINHDSLNQYLAVGTNTGNIEIHKLKKNFYSSKPDNFLEEIKIFLSYVSIL